MKLAISFLILLAQSSHLGAQASSGSPGPDESKLIALENAWNLAQLQHDSMALDQLVGDRFVYTDYDGTVMNKVQFLADIRDPSYKPSLMTNENMRVFLYTDAAVVIGTYHAKGTAAARASTTPAASPIPGSFTKSMAMHGQPHESAAEVEVVEPGLLHRLVLQPDISLSPELGPLRGTRGPAACVSRFGHGCKKPPRLLFEKRGNGALEL